MGKKSTPPLLVSHTVCDSDTSMDNTDGEVFLKKQTGLSDAFVSFTENFQCHFIPLKMRTSLPLSQTAKKLQHVISG